jgi:hypothetical protein
MGQQTPLEQVLPRPDNKQVLPHVPQLAASRLRSVQAPLQLVVPVGQQTPLEQVSPVPQA